MAGKRRCLRGFNACGSGAVCMSKLWQVSPAPGAVPNERHVLGLALSCREQAGFGEQEAAGSCSTSAVFGLKAAISMVFSPGSGHQYPPRHVLLLGFFLTWGLLWL